MPVEPTAPGWPRWRCCSGPSRPGSRADRVLQYHGGYGYSAEYDVQLYYRRAAGWLLQLGEPSAEIARLADADLGEKNGAA